MRASWMLAVAASAVCACRYGFGERTDASVGSDGGIRDVARDGVLDAAMPGAVDAAFDARVNAVGCADGTREGFLDEVAFPAIAGCAASWAGTPSLRANQTGTGCGDGLGICWVPADACSAGWHICGLAGDPTELTARATADECDSAGGSSGTFLAAISHCSDYVAGVCDYVPPYQCLDNALCSEAQCCGAQCNHGEACTDGGYPAGRTGVFGSVTEGCGAQVATAGVGVMCCL